MHGCQRECERVVVTNGRVRVSPQLRTHHTILACCNGGEYVPRLGLRERTHDIWDERVYHNSCCTQSTITFLNTQNTPDECECETLIYTPYI